ncbi:MAG TPA: tRNA (adenosine(37)-N6)-dimethylallyltransferase MiaA [bacterium]|nr:tRNA (adenosine(37)-N6)-dimethylallyltransferase MiaA [bacterium]
MSPNPPKLLVLVGPTAVGKTEVAFHVALALKAEIVSADSRLVYRHMDIGTAKPDRRMQDQVPHHLIDLVEPDQQYTSKQYERDARQAVAGILARGKVPLVVGGTGLYVRALLEGIFEGPAADPAARRRLLETARLEGKAALWRRLLEVDPEKASRTDPENLPRVARALEVFEATGPRMSDLEKTRQPLGLPVAKIGLARARQELTSLIGRRVEEMLNLGLLDEATSLVRMGYGESPVVKNSLGYQEVLSHLAGEISLERARDLIKQHTRLFAKRQMTWFRKEPDLTWMDLTGRSDPQDIAAEVCSLYHQSGLSKDDHAPGLIESR